jgi:alkanesulfonate monooxygenase SsuD/methylene tetrahydromethanopterin reductase-like flavin-dependent oxidoreductase (luciferase family)
MRFGLSIPNFGDWADPRRIARLAREAEDAGWDGFFLWDHVRFSANPACRSTIPGCCWRRSRWPPSAAYEAAEQMASDFFA